MGNTDGVVRPQPSDRNLVPLPRVMIVSPVLLYRDGLAASLSADGRLDVVGVTDPQHAAALLISSKPSAIVFDASADEGLALARRLRRLDENIVLVGFGISNHDARIVACAEAGLAGFIDENGSIEALVGAVLDALRGEFSCSPRVTALLCERLAMLADGEAERLASSASSLTPREREVALLVSEGLSNKEIALDLSIGPATVKNHVHNILDKLGVRRRAAIAARVTEAQ